jgi:hypothetical protein
VIFRRAAPWGNLAGVGKTHEKNRSGSKILQTIELVECTAHGKSSICGRKFPSEISVDSFGQSHRAGLRCAVRSNTVIVIESGRRGSSSISASLSILQELITEGI